jgi:membrane protease YdiL (CAAX protease family)
MMCAVAFLAFGAVYIFMVAAGGELRQIASAGLEAGPFAILAVLAYASNPKGIGGKALTLTYWVLLVGAVGIGSLLVTIVVVLQLKVGGDPRAALPPPTVEQILRILAAGFALAAAGGIGILCFVTGIRRWAATWLDMDPQSFVHATALATTVTMTLMCTIPLLAVNEPLIAWLFNPKSGLNMTGSELTVSSTLYGLMWAVPASFIAVGFPIKRTLREAQQRLALVVPSRLQVVAAIAIALALALAAAPVHFVIGMLWKALGLRMTDTHAVEALFKNAITPAGAVIVGISAGLGEELVFRGVLLPRLGIVLPALLFTALHAFQYNFDALVWILILGVVLGFVRKKTNTTTCVLIHGTYDLVLLLAAYLFGS